MYTYDIVFLDNDLYLSHLVCKTLSEQGYKVTTFNDWFEAIRILRNYPTKILIFNELSCNINIVDYIKFARTNLPNTKLYISLEREIDSLERDLYYEKKINGIIVKPFSMYDIINLIKWLKYSITSRRY